LFSTVVAAFSTTIDVDVVSVAVSSAKTFEVIKRLGVRDWKIRRNPVKRETAF